MTREPETQETWHDEFDATGKSSKWCREEVENRLIRLRRDAANFAKELLIKHGYFNGEIHDTVIRRTAETGEYLIGVKVVLSCYGLPWAFEDAETEIARLKEIIEDCYLASCCIADGDFPPADSPNMASLLHLNVVDSRNRVNGEA